MNARAQPEVDSGAALRSHYNLMVATATRAREELRAQLGKGLPALVPLPQYADGHSCDGMLILQHTAVCRLVNAYAWANRVLWNAAQAVCDCENLPDDGDAEGIVWEVSI